MADVGAQLKLKKLGSEAFPDELSFNPGQTLGRKKGDINVDTISNLSRLHCKFDKQGDTWNVLEPELTSHGTYVYFRTREDIMNSKCNTPFKLPKHAHIFINYSEYKVL